MRAGLLGDVTVLVALMLGSGACGFSAGDSTTRATQPASDARTTHPDARDQTPTGRATPGSTRSDDVDIELPRNARVIVAPLRSHGDRTFTFDPRRHVFSSTFVCHGDGPVVIDLRGPGRPNTARCDGVMSHFAFVTDGSRQTLEIRAAPPVEWQLAVTDGDGPGIRVHSAR